MAVSKRLRFEILRRDNHACRYCGATAPDATLTVDHVVPQALGGSDEPTNLVAACKDCNAGKSSISVGAPLVDDVQADALRWAKAMELAALERESQRDANNAALMMFWETWHNVRLHPYAYGDLGPGWENSILEFLKAGLTLGDLAELASVAWGNRKATNTWRYFCGCCWTRLRQAQARAAEIVAMGSEDEAVG